MKHVQSAWHTYNRAVVSNGKIMGGSINAVFNKGGADLMHWLSDETPEGATVMETMAAICLDAMIEEKESK